MENFKYRVIYEYEFHRGTNAAETARKMYYVYSCGILKKKYSFWFQQFCSVNFNRQNKARVLPETKADNEELKTILETELAAGCGVSDNLEKWVPYESSKASRQTRLDLGITLLNRHNIEGILDRIIICDEKWIMYDSKRKCSSQWLNTGEPTKPGPERKLTQKKSLVSIWWTSASVVHYNFLKSS
ncbi:unnamed protein product [Euphydryas editha]|uniref:Mos1 transposase HTH domain-containing protein n=1 Tax=Euphydryas editha TaxID=104508 RepID=A0AAU9UBP3_EUPED|nr:unnamed protein product [Euphydryas editha]